jgi:hypothetical protein
MDHTRILNEIRGRQTLEQAFDYAIYDRIHTDFWFDYFEIEYVAANKELVLDEIVAELKEPEQFGPRLAYAYFAPKTALCYRRMVYLPFKDLVVRYAFCTVFAEYLDGGMSPNSSANRRASGDRAKCSLLQDFSATSWPNFCTWQREQAKRSSVLLRTDISSFYDSISHCYLLDAIADELSLRRDSPVMNLLHGLLSVTVISYSRETGEIKQDDLKQGLPIGNGTEGFLANIYLNRVDAAMNSMSGSPAISFGRYNDDMRIFGQTRAGVLDAVRLLQELLLVKGLNLNAGKTELAENAEQVEELRSKDYELYGYLEEEDEAEEEEAPAVSQAPTPVQSHVDVHFHEFDRRFAPGEPLKEDKDAKEFCKFLSTRGADGTPLIHISERLPEHIETLRQVLTKWQGSGKHAAWLLVQSAFYRGIRVPTAKKAKEVVFDLLEVPNVNPYIRYRLLHHLVKPRQDSKGREYRFLDRLSETEKARLKQRVPLFVAEPAFELNLVSLYLSRCLGASRAQLEELVRDHAIKPDADPIRNALSYLESRQLATKIPPLSFAHEPDDIQPNY